MDTDNTHTHKYPKQCRLMSHFYKRNKDSKNVTQYDEAINIPATIDMHLDVGEFLFLHIPLK